MVQIFPIHRIATISHIPISPGWEAVTFSQQFNLLESGATIILQKAFPISLKFPETKNGSSRFRYSKSSIELHPSRNNNACAISRRGGREGGREGTSTRLPALTFFPSLPLLFDFHLVFSREISFIFFPSFFFLPSLPPLPLLCLRHALSALWSEKLANRGDRERGRKGGRKKKGGEVCLVSRSFLTNRETIESGIGKRGGRERERGGRGGGEREEERCSIEERKAAIGVEETREANILPFPDLFHGRSPTR